MPFRLDPELEKYCVTENQLALLKAWERHGSQRKAAAEMDVDKRRLQQVFAAVTKRAAQHGYAPDYDMRHEVPPGFKARGVSTLYDMQSGEAKVQWVKTQADEDARWQAMQEAVNALCADAPRFKPVPAPKATVDELLNLYVLTDYHHGMRAWRRETKDADWDLDIAGDLLVKAFGAMMANAPDAASGLVCQLGDFLHTDFPALVAETPVSGHSLDSDGRAEKVIERAITILRAVVDMALSKHDKVHVLMAEGNHDMVGSVWLRSLFHALYEKEPRVTVEKSPLPYYAHQHGETALFFHHGHLRKLPQMPGVFAAQFPEVWGACKYRYAHTGHFHHKIKIDEKEDMGCTVTQHRTLAPRDSYAARGGYFSERKAECLTYHKAHGLVASTHVTPEMVAA